MTVEVNLNNESNLWVGTNTVMGDNDHLVNGNAGNDSLFGGWGNDILYGGNEAYANGSNFFPDGDDVLDGGQGFDLLAGGSGKDTLLGGSQEDTLFGGLGNDYLNGGADDDILIGGMGNDALTDTSGNNRFIGVQPGDRFGRGEIDTLTGGMGDDTFVLGDHNGVTFYNDRQGAIGSSGDGLNVPISQAQGYAVIREFDLNYDKIELAKGSSASDYLLKTGFFVDDSAYHPAIYDTAIYRKFETPVIGGGTATSYELIGVISGVSDLNMSMNCFQF